MIARKYNAGEETLIVAVEVAKGSRTLDSYAHELLVIIENYFDYHSAATIVPEACCLECLAHIVDAIESVRDHLLQLWQRSIAFGGSDYLHGLSVAVRVSPYWNNVNLFCASDRQWQCYIGRPNPH